MKTTIQLKPGRATTFYELSPAVIITGKLTRLGDNGDLFYVFMTDWLQPLTLGPKDFEIIGAGK